MKGYDCKIVENFRAHFNFQNPEIGVRIRFEKIWMSKRKKRRTWVLSLCSTTAQEWLQADDGSLSPEEAANEIAGMLGVKPEAKYEDVV